jgi:ABC-2 type transport system permease protein
VIARQLRVIGVVFMLHLKQVAVDLFVIFTVIVQPLIVAALAIFMLRGKPSFEAIYVVVGSALTGLWSGTLFFSAFNISFERWTGTLEEIVASPTSLQTVIIGKSLANAVMSFSSMFFGYALISMIFGFDLSISNLPAFIVSAVLTLGSLIALGLVIAPFMAINIGANAWANALEFPMYILGGFLFPLAILPNWVTPISYILAPYWGARAMHGTSSGEVPIGDVLLSWGMMILFITLYLLVSRWLFKKLLHKARVEATLGIQ